MSLSKEIQVYCFFSESPTHFQGISEGKFLEKKRYKNVVNNNEYFTPQDLMVGKDVIVNGYSFHIMDCDEITQKWYAENFK